MKGKEALDECIRMWRLNDTFNGTAVNHGRMLSPDGKMCLFDDESWDYFISNAGCGPAICGYGQQRRFRRMYLADYLRGDPQGAGHWTHPDCHLYLDWYNRYDAPTCGLSRVQ